MIGVGGIRPSRGLSGNTDGFRAHGDRAFGSSGVLGRELVEQRHDLPDRVAHRVDRIDVPPGFRGRIVHEVLVAPGGFWWRDKSIRVWSVLREQLLAASPDAIRLAVELQLMASVGSKPVIGYSKTQVRCIANATANLPPPGSPGRPCD